VRVLDRQASKEDLVDGADDDLGGEELFVPF